LKSIGLLLDQYFRKFDQIGQKPGILTYLIWLLRGLVNKPSRDYSALKRYFFANRRPTKAALAVDDLPEIEVIFVSKLEDIQILGLAVNSVVKNSINPISRVVIAVPANQCMSTSEYFFNSVNNKLVEVISENELVPQAAIELIKQKSPERFGWILQQILVASFILSTKSENVLIVDSDTLIIRPQVWIDKFKRQILMPTFELHLPYYKFFQHFSTKYPTPKMSFVSHHMLVQTPIFREVYQIFGGDVYKAVEQAFAFADLRDNSPFDLKYEIYAQYLINNYKNQVSFVKWANLSCSRRELATLIEGKSTADGYARLYNSLSLHHWNH
jgi:hypothetical protein